MATDVNSQKILNIMLKKITTGVYEESMLIDCIKMTNRTSESLTAMKTF